MRELVDRIQKIDAIPILFGYPLEREGYTKQHREKLKNLAVDMDVLHFDPQAQMEEESRQSQMYFSRDRGHANVAGNAKIAEWVYLF